MRKFLSSLYIEKRFFVAITILAALFVLSFLFGRMLLICKLLFFVLLAAFIADIVLLFLSKGTIEGKRAVPEKLSNGDENKLTIEISNHYLFPTRLKIVDEIPFQFQKRDFEIKAKMASGESNAFDYSLRPTERGVYSFGKLNIYATSPLQLVSRKFHFNEAHEVPVYPSFLQLRKYLLMAFSNRLFEFGLKKIRRIGHTMEFEQIKDYVQGDDIRNINWNATAKRNQLMVNQFQDEKSQPIYSIIDKGRVMKMPFNGLSLLDYAINSTLVISNVAIKKQDKAGMLTFSKSVDNKIIADRKSIQMNLILENLYKVSNEFHESDFSRLYVQLKRTIKQRSLLMLYTNFETMDALNRQIPYLQAIAKQHLLIVIFFENSELIRYAEEPGGNSREIFEKTVAEKFIHEKKRIVKELNNFGIQTILTKPENLTIQTLNKYLEIKARGLI